MNKLSYFIENIPWEVFLLSILIGGLLAIFLDSIVKKIKIGWHKFRKN